MVEKCPAENTAQIDQEEFWNGHFDAHKIGWIISGSAAAVTVAISFFTIYKHATNYTRPLEQRQIIRILLFAPVFAIFSFFSYRFFRSYTYYSLAEVVYEAFAIAAFTMLILQYVGESVERQKDVFQAKDKRKLPMPLCCWRYRPSKAYFLHLIKWSVIQYVVVRPLLSVAGIVLEYYEILCEQSMSYRYGHVYLLAIDFASISIALYGLIVLYGLVKDELKGKRPLAKFMTIKLAIFFTFYQSFVFSVLQDRGVIKATTYWTATNVSDGLNALCTTLEMVVVAAFQVWAFPWSEYKPGAAAEQQEEATLEAYEDDGVEKSAAAAATTSKMHPLRALLHALNFSDFFVELWHSVRFGIDRLRGKRYTRSDKTVGKFDFVEIFGGAGRQSRFEKVKSKIRGAGKRGGGSGSGLDASHATMMGGGEEEARGHYHHNRGTRGSSGEFDMLENRGGVGRRGPGRLGSSTEEEGEYDEEGNLTMGRDSTTGLIPAEYKATDSGNTTLHSSPSGMGSGKQRQYAIDPNLLSNPPGMTRLSPTPRSPRESAGRFPAFVPDQEGGRGDQAWQSYEMQEVASTGYQNQSMRPPIPPSGGGGARQGVPGPQRQQRPASWEPQAM